MATQLVFKIDPILLQRRPPRLTLAATLQTLGKRIRNEELDVNFVVDILDQNRLLPYMIHNNKNLFDVALGRKTSASKIGDLIVSEECIRGTYELTVEFLDFVLATISRPNYKDTTKTMLASIIYVANEIYPSLHLWTYRDQEDSNRILCRCTEIFHQIITTTKEPIRDELQAICIISLSQNQAHKQLLDVIVDGKNSIKRQIQELNISSGAGLSASSIVISVRQSLSIFKKLLTFGKFVKQICDTQSVNQNNKKQEIISQYQQGASNTPMTNIEKALFDTSIRPGLLQHLFSYIYQESDSTTACLALDLIKKIAKKFSMSLLASLGSEADKVCNFFVDYLANEETSKLCLVISILDLLSTCVKHQPGLIELFLNSTGSSGTSTSNKKKASLDVVIDLLRGCKNRQDDSDKLLYSHMLKFILTFWQKNHSAIVKLDLEEKFWDSITNPLLEFLDEQQDEFSTNKLTPYVLMILAREIHCVKGEFNDRKMNPNLIQLLKIMSQKDLLVKYSSFLRDYYDKINGTSDNKRLLPGWRDFLVSFAKYEPFETSPEVRDKMIADLIVSLQFELRKRDSLDKENVAYLGEIMLSTWVRWLPKNEYTNQHDRQLNGQEEEVSKRQRQNLFRSMQELLYLANNSKEYLPFTFLLSFQSIVNLYLVRNLDYLTSQEFEQESRAGPASVDLLVPSVELMLLAVKMVSKSIQNQFGTQFNSTFINVHLLSDTTPGNDTRTNPDSSGASFPLSLSMKSLLPPRQQQEHSSHQSTISNSKPATITKTEIPTASATTTTTTSMTSTATGSQSLSQSSSSQHGIEMRFCVSTIWTVRFIIQISRCNVDLWLEYVRTHLRLELLVEFSIMLINGQIGNEICIAIVELFHCLSSIREGADLLTKTGLIEQVSQIANHLRKELEPVA